MLANALGFLNKCSPPAEFDRDAILCSSQSVHRSIYTPKLLSFFTPLNIPRPFLISLHFDHTYQISKPFGPHPGLRLRLRASRKALPPIQQKCCLQGLDVPVFPVIQDSLQKLSEISRRKES